MWSPFKAHEQAGWFHNKIEYECMSMIDLHQGTLTCYLSYFTLDYRVVVSFLNCSSWGLVSLIQVFIEYLWYA